MWVRLPEAGREGMTPPQLSLQKWQPPGEPRPGWTPSLQSRSPPPSTTTQHSPHLSSSGAQKDRRLICNTYKLRGSGQTHCPHQACFLICETGRHTTNISAAQTVTNIKRGVCETIKQQKQVRNFIIRNNHLFGNTFLNAFNTLLCLQRMLKKKKTSRAEMRC